MKCKKKPKNKNNNFKINKKLLQIEEKEFYKIYKLKEFKEMQKLNNSKAHNKINKRSHKLKLGKKNQFLKNLLFNLNLIPKNIIIKKQH